MVEDLPPIYSKDFLVSTVEKQPRGSARAQEIYKRSMLKSSDGRTLDDHDQFYRDHKLLLKLFQVLGAMPIQRGEIGRITFGWFSIPAVYAYCFYSITTVIVLMVGQERLLILTTKSKEFDEKIYSIIFVLYLVPHFWIPFTGWSVAREVCDYKNSWGPFQLHYYKITGKGMEFPYLNTLIVIISSGCLILAVVFLTSLSALLDGFTLYHTLAYYHIITTINMNCALWYINCRAIGNASKCVADSFERDMDQHTCAYIISQYRFLWLRLSDIVQKLGNAYARTYSAYSLFMLANITVAIYGFTSEIVDHGFRFTFKEIGLLVDTTYCAMLLFIFCDCSHQASINISNRVQRKLMNVKLTKVDPSTYKEIEHFLVAIRINSPKVSLKGYTVVNRELLSSVTNYDYSIQVPKFPCFPNKTQEATTIRVTGKDATKLSYEWKVNFKTNSTCLQQQRCTLLIWKSVRNVEKSFVSKTTEIKINNTLLMPTVQYLLNVTVRVNSTFVGTKEFILECTNSSTFTDGGSAPPEKLNNDPHVNLFGSNVTYRDMTYILNAEAANCVENNSYYYKWELLDQFQNIVESDFHKGSILKFDSKMLKAETEYLIRCSIIDSRYASVIAMIKWSCSDEKNRPCVNFKSVNSTVLDGIILPNIGTHNFSITVARKNVKATDFCEVKSIPDAYATIEIDDIDVPVDPSKEIVVPAYINSLVTGCTLQWKSLSLKQYGYVDLNKLPGNVDALTNITIMEDEFLNEIDEYTNNTIDKEYNLIIPKPDGKWLGVKGNSSYLFRLNVTCPDLKDVTDSLDSIEELLALNPVTLTADVLIYTDNPPVMNSLHINPLNGTALKTYFTFYTKLIYNESPMLYKFGYVLNNQTVFVESMLGVERCRSLLPYIGTGVKTVLEVCNSNGLCSQIIGPTVLTAVPILSDDDKNYFLMELNELIKREEYYKVFVHAVAISETYDNMKDFNSSKSFGTFINDLIISEIKRLLKSNQEEERWIVSANNLIKDVGILLNKISASDELLNNIIALRNRVSNKKDYTSLVEEVEPQYSVRKLLSVNRVKRNVEKITLEEVKSYLVISELIITTSNDKKRVQQEKQHLLNQVDKFMTQLCGTLHEKPQTMNLVMKMF
ncbi:hypothetical protein FQR65_LT00570 [Abscondita terminalis]|nr:hypothetical protein FQR65_LT00570 [Abscondita terminalis]